MDHGSTETHGREDRNLSDTIVNHCCSRLVADSARRPSGHDRLGTSMPRLAALPRADRPQSDSQCSDGVHSSHMDDRSHNPRNGYHAICMEEVPMEQDHGLQLPHILAPTGPSSTRNGYGHIGNEPIVVTAHIALATLVFASALTGSLISIGYGTREVGAK